MIFQWTLTNDHAVCWIACSKITRPLTVLNVSMFAFRAHQVLRKWDNPVGDLGYPGNGIQAGHLIDGNHVFRKRLHPMMWYLQWGPLCWWDHLSKATKSLTWCRRRFLIFWNTGLLEGELIIVCLQLLLLFALHKLPPSLLLPNIDDWRLIVDDWDLHKNLFKKPQQI